MVLDDVDDEDADEEEEDDMLADEGKHLLFNPVALSFHQYNLLFFFSFFFVIFLDNSRIERK